MNEFYMDLYKNGASRKRIIIYNIFIVILLVYHASLYYVVKADDIASRNEVGTLSITFEEYSFTASDSRTIDDGEREIIDISIPDEQFANYSGLGMLKIEVSYEETSGQIADPCDTISVDLTPNEVLADWNNEGNILSEMSDDCSTMTLILYVFPDYSSEQFEVESDDQEYWENQWTDRMYGNGIFELEVEVSSNQPPASPIPTISDDDEEVNINIEAVFFTVNVE